MTSKREKGEKHIVLKVGSRGFFVTTNDITKLSTALESECRPERVSEGHYFFEFVIPFHTPAEASFHLKHLLGDDEYSMVIGNLK